MSVASISVERLERGVRVVINVPIRVTVESRDVSADVVEKHYEVLKDRVNVFAAHLGDVMRSFVSSLIEAMHSITATETGVAEAPSEAKGKACERIVRAVGMVLPVPMKDGSVKFRYRGISDTLRRLTKDRRFVIHNGKLYKLTRASQFTFKVDDPDVHRLLLEKARKGVWLRAEIRGKPPEMIIYLD